MFLMTKLTLILTLIWPSRHF